MKAFALAFVLSTLTVPAFAQDPVRAYVFTQPAVGGFTDEQSQQRAAAVQFTIARMQQEHKQDIAIATAREGADLIVEVLDVTDVDSGAQSASRIAPGVVIHRKGAPHKRISVQLSAANDYTQAMHAQHRKLDGAGERLGDDLGKWVKANHAQVLAARR